MNKKRYSLWMLFILFIPLCAFSQDLVLEPYTVSGQYLNAQINADTASAEFKAGTRVYVLKRDGIYLNNAIIVLTGAGKQLNIRSEISSGHYPPTIYLYPTTAGTGNPPGWFADLGGATLRMSGVILTGYYELIDTCLDRIQGGLIRLNTSGSGGSVYIDNCILKSINGQLIRTEGKPKTISVTNTICADMGFEGTSNFGAGKLVDLRDQDVDTCRIENCTIVNYQDRIIRHYQSTKGPIRNLFFNHNTVVNGVSYHGMLSLGRVDSSGTGQLQIKNNLFIDPFALGADTCALRQAEFGDAGELDPTNNLPRITWIIANKNLAANWDISNNYYSITDSGQAMLNLPLPNGPYYQNEGSPLTWGINARLAVLGKDTTVAFKKITAQLTNTPKLMTTQIRWIYRPRSEGGDGKEKNNNDPNFTKIAGGNWAYDYNRHKVEYYFDTLNCDFRASEQLVSSDGEVVGDTRWTYLGSTVPPVTSFFDDFGNGAADGWVAEPGSGAENVYTLTETGGVLNIDYHRVAGYDWASILFNPPSPIQPVCEVGNNGKIKLSVRSTIACTIAVKPIYASTDDWLTFAVPGDNTWMIADLTLSLGKIMASPIEKFYIYVNGGTATAESGIVQFDNFRVFDVNHTPNAVETGNNPRKFALGQNYPNPFNPSTSFTYEIAKAGFVSVKVYDLLGREVAKLVNEFKQAGSYQLTWKAGSFGSGIYFYKMQSGSFTSTKKMILMK